MVSCTFLPGPFRLDLILDRNRRAVGAGLNSVPADDISPGPLTSVRRTTPNASVPREKSNIIHPVRRSYIFTFWITLPNDTIVVYGKCFSRCNFHGITVEMRVSRDHFVVLFL